MRIDFQIIFWLLVISFVVIATVMRIIKQKKQEGDRENGGDESSNVRINKLRKVQQGKNWQLFLDNLIGGVETGITTTRIKARRSYLHRISKKQKKHY